MAQIDITADTAQSITAMDALNATLAANNDRIKEITSSVGVFNKRGIETSSVIKGLTQDGKQFEATLGLIGKTANKYAKMGIDVDLQLKQIKFKDTFKPLAEEAEDAGTKIGILGSVLNRVGRNMVQFISYRTFGVIADSIQEGVKAAKDFEIQISLIRTISQDAQLSFVDFGKAIRDVSDKSGIDIKQVGKAFYDVTSNQIAKGADVGPFVKSATDLARVTGSELPDAVNVLSSRINAYGLSIHDAEKLSAEFFRTVDEGRVVLSEIANTLGRVDVLASNLGVNQNEVNAIIAITTQRGFKAADSLTLLTNIMTQLEKPTAAMTQFFESLNVSSGEAAIKISGGVIPLISKLVAATQSGQLSAAELFPDIRGRKQFAVFQQALPDIQRFNTSLQDTTKTIEIYNKAIEIRGESPADLLVKESNKLANVFKVDLGTSILESVAKFSLFTGGIDSLKNTASGVSDLMGTGAKALAAYAFVAVGATATNTALAASFGAVGIAAGAAIRFLYPLAIFYAGFKSGEFIGEKLLGSEKVLGGLDLSTLDATIERVKTLKKEIEDAKRTGGVKVNPFADIDEAAKNVSQTFRTIVGTLAAARGANASFLQDAKDRAKVAADAVKVGFSGFTDVIKNQIKDVRKTVTEANTEIEKSIKSGLKFKDTVEQALFATRSKYANEDFGGTFGTLGGQKATLLQQRLIELKQQTDAAFAKGTKEDDEEGRRLLVERIKITQELFDLQQSVGKRQAEQAGETGIYLVNDTKLKQDLYALEAESAAREISVQERNKKRIEDGKALVAVEETRLRTLEQQLNAFEKIDVLDKSGKVKAEYQTSGKFDSSKLISDLDKVQSAAVKAAYDPTLSPEENMKRAIELQVFFFQQRSALLKLASNVERDENLKTLQEKAAGDEQLYQQRLKKSKDERDAILKSQQDVLGALLGKTQEAGAFVKNLFAAGVGVTAKPKVIADLEAKAKDFAAALIDLRDNPVIKDGIPGLDPEKLDTAKIAYFNYINAITEANRKYAGNREISEKGVTPGESLDDFNRLVDKAMAGTNALADNLTRQKVDIADFNNNILGPVKALADQFPALKATATDSLDAINSKFADLATGPGIKQLKEELQKVQDLLKPATGKGPGQQQGMADIFNIEGGEAYAAVGGIVGMFPGQPRGQDRYPIWAAKGEAIISAKTYELYKPMVDAIMSRRMPRYMAGGGVVGDTNIGDINVTVNGAHTNSDTGRAIAMKLERELRRRNISLKPR